MNGIVTRISTIVALFFLLAVSPATVISAPTSPLFGPETKLFEGQATAPGMKYGASSGNSVYVATMTDDSKSGTEQIRVAKMAASGSAVNASGVAVAKPHGILTDSLSIAVSDAKAPAKNKIVHLLWIQQEAGEAGLYYSWATDNNLNKWSAPVRISGGNTRVASASIRVGAKGDRHVIFIGDGPKIFYTRTIAGKDEFSSPLELPGVPHFDERDAGVALDKNGTLHVVFVATKSPTYEDVNEMGLQYTSLKAGTDKWAAPKELIPLSATTDKGNVGIAATGSAIFVASTLVNKRNLELYKSDNNGDSWTKSIVSSANNINQPGLDIAPDNAVTVGALFEQQGKEGNEARIFRSADGVTWTPLAVIPNREMLGIVVDGNGKAAIFSKRQEAGNSEDSSYLFREK
jgi:hypothetical protein